MSGAAAASTGRTRRSSFGRLPGSSATHRPAPGSSPTARSNIARGRVGARQIDERMPDELDGHAGLLVDRRLERKDHEHAIDVAANRLEPPGAPRPELRADVVDDRHAERAASTGSSRKLKSGKSIATKTSGRRARAASPQACRSMCHDRGRTDERLDQAGDGEAAIVADEIGAGRRAAAAPPNPKTSTAGSMARMSARRARRRTDRRRLRRTRSSRGARPLTWRSRGGPRRIRPRSCAAGRRGAPQRRRVQIELRRAECARTR